MKTLKHLFILVAVSAIVFSCGNAAKKVEDKLNEAVEEMENAVDDATTTDLVMTELDMTEKGIPVVMEVPEGTEVTEGIMHETEGEYQYYDYELTFDKYVINVTMDPAGMYETAEEMVESAKDLYLDEDSELVEEFDGGFIYKTDYDGDEDYSFYYMIVKDENAIEFTTGLTFEFYSLEDVKVMLGACKSVK
jgi:hypothetical protein